MAEPIAIRVVNNVLGRRFSKPSLVLLNHLFDKLLTKSNASDTSKGKAWEYLILGRLLDYNEKSIQEFICSFYNEGQVCDSDFNIVSLPAWTHNAILKVSSYGNAEMFSRQQNSDSVMDDVDVIHKLLLSPDDRRFILQPCNIMRPDGLYIGEVDQVPRRYWTLLFSAKFFSSSMSSDKTIGEDLTSTDWDRAFYTKDGGTKFSGLIAKLNNARSHFDHIGSLRIHFILPGLSSSSEGHRRGGCTVDGTEIVMYIDQSMIDNLFDSSPAIVDGIKAILLRS